MLSAKAENRGKRSVSDVEARAANFGCTRVLFLHEANGNPSKLSFYGKEGWLEPEIAVSSAEVPAKEKAKIRLPRDVSVIAEGKDPALKEEIKHLLDLDEPETEDAVELHLKNNALWFEYDGRKIGPSLRISASKVSEQK